MSKIIEITDISMSELDVFAPHSETQLRHYFEPDGGVFIAESPKVIERALDSGCLPLAFLAERSDLDGELNALIKRCADTPVYTADMDVIAALTGFKLIRGALCAMRRKPLPAVWEICANAHRVAVLEDVVNPTNVGAIFRSAAALNIDAVLLTPACSDPLYRRASRVSMGTVFQAPWTYIGKESSDWHEQGISLLHEMGFSTAAMALCDRSVSIDDPRLMAEEKLAIILGTEGDGLAEKTIADSDYTVKIPMTHGVDSLNVAAASAVAFWQLAMKK